MGQNNLVDGFQQSRPESYVYVVGRVDNLVGDRIGRHRR